MTRLFQYLGNYRKNVLFATLSSITNKIFDLMPPFLTAWIIDSVSGHIPAWIGQYTGLSDPWPIVVFLAILALVVFGFESFFEWLYKRSFMRLAQRVQHDLRMDAYRKLQSREMAYFENQRTGNLLAMLNDDINQLERFLNNSFNEIIQLITLILFAGWALCSVSLPLGLLGMAPIPFIILGSIYYQKKVAPLYQKVRERVGWLSNRLENNLSGILVIKSFATEQYESERVRSVSEAYRDANFKAIRWSSVYVPLIRIPITLGFAGTLLIGAYWVLYTPAAFSLGNLAFFAMMIQRLLWPVTQLGTVFDEYQRAGASARRIFSLIDASNEIKNTAVPTPLPHVAGNISFENVNFQYQDQQEVLRGVNLKIEAGQTIGVAGPTGGGKTTLIKLLLRLYDVQEGSIRLEGIDLRDLDIRSLRQQIALVSQEVYLFHGTIRDNIAYGLPECPQEKIETAARKAHLHDFIAQLPMGYDSIVGERGIKLSGGQRQRLSVARAILKDAPILILDEATSAVDTETEKIIQENLQHLTANKTAIIIAHRLSTIRQADQIIVIQDGIIAEMGSHDKLLAQKGTYAALWQVQTGSLIDG
ncbi:MAG: ABC transporter ATP-binding protein [Saprospiraceae bacterium]|nr:MAG: ABC transporter ATP-binding protein [Saprospiraceae bacterium]